MGRDKQYFDDQTFESVDFSIDGAQDLAFTECVFRQCNFNSTDISRTRFTDCRFEGCDLSLANISDTSFQDIEFQECNLTGLRFDECNPLMFRIRCAECIADFASFTGMEIKKTHFTQCRLREADFSESNLSESAFTDCDLDRAVFQHTNLQGTDFTSALNYEIDPENNQVRKARFSLSGVRGLLAKYDVSIE